MVFVTGIDDVQLCMVSICMQGFPLACGLRQPGSKWLQAGFRRRSRNFHSPSWSKWLPAGPLKTSRETFQDLFQATVFKMASSTPPESFQNQFQTAWFKMASAGLPATWLKMASSRPAESFQDVCVSGYLVQNGLQQAS